MVCCVIGNNANKIITMYVSLKKSKMPIFSLLGMGSFYQGERLGSFEVRINFPQMEVGLSRKGPQVTFLVLVPVTQKNHSTKRTKSAKWYSEISF